jgi:hypothetical protein
MERKRRKTEDKISLNKTSQHNTTQQHNNKTDTDTDTHSSTSTTVKVIVIVIVTYLLSTHDVTKNDAP